MVDTPSLAELLRKHRVGAHLSQEALAERAGISPRTIGDIETGTARLPRSMTVSLIVGALGLDPAARAEFYQAARRRAPAPPGAPRTAPREAPVLIGRDEELSRVHALLADEEVRLVTLVGGAGIGKTALALNVARDAVSRFDDVVTVELAGLPDAALVPTKVALAAGVGELRGESMTASIAGAIDRRMLLVLDTFEHLAEAAPFVAALLAATTSLKVVVTSRVPLRIPGERLVKVGSLSSTASVALLVERVKHYKPEFEIAPHDVDGSAALFRALDGVPFAIELAAPLLRVSSPAALGRRLDHPLDVLVAERPDVPPRRRTMRDAIAWSYELLPPEQRHVLRRLGIFQGAFTVEAAHHVICDDASTDTLTTLRTLATLADQHLVRVVEYPGCDPRFELPRLVCDYADELLVRSDEREALHERLADYCTALAIEGDALRPGAGHAPQFARVDLESPTFDAVLDWMRSSGRVDAALALAIRLRSYWWLRGAHAHGDLWLSSLLALAEERNDTHDALLSDAYWAAAGLAQASGRFERSAQHIERALPHKRAIGDRKAVASLLSGAGVCARHRGDLEAARAFLEEGLAIRRELGDPIAVAQSLCDLGTSAEAAGDLATAAAHLEESLGIFRAAGSEVGVSAALANLANLALHSKMPARAEVFARESLRIAEGAGFDDAARVARYLLARTALERDDVAAAESLMRVIVHAGDAGASVPAPDILRLYAAIRHARGEWAEAARLLGAASTVPAEEITPPDQAAYEGLRGSIATALGSAFETEWTVGRAGGVRSAIEALRSDG